MALIEQAMDARTLAQLASMELRARARRMAARHGTSVSHEHEQKAYIGFSNSTRAPTRLCLQVRPSSDRSPNDA